VERQSTTNLRDIVPKKSNYQIKYAIGRMVRGNWKVRPETKKFLQANYQKYCQRFWSE